MAGGIKDGYDLRRLNFLLEFLAAWETRPASLTAMAYKWCSIISKVAGPRLQVGHQTRFTPKIVATDELLAAVAEQNFSFVEPSFEPARTDEASHHTRRHLQAPVNFPLWIYLPMILEVGFRLVMPGRDQPDLRLNHTRHHDLMFKSVFSSDDDDVIADGVCAWVADDQYIPAGPCAHYLSERVEKDTPFSPRLRRMGIRLIECMWLHNREVYEMETSRLLNRLDVVEDDMEYQEMWARLLRDVFYSPAGIKNLSIHYCHLVARLNPLGIGTLTTELVRLLEEAEDWEKFEVWMVLAWQSIAREYSEPFWLKDLEYLTQVTVDYLLRRPLALPRFEGFEESEDPPSRPCVTLRRICALAREEQLSLEPLLL